MPSHGETVTLPPCTGTLPHAPMREVPPPRAAICLRKAGPVPAGLPRAGGRGHVHPRHATTVRPVRATRVGWIIAPVPGPLPPTAAAAAMCRATRRRTHGSPAPYDCAPPSAFHHLPPAYYQPPQRLHVCVRQRPHSLHCLPIPRDPGIDHVRLRLSRRPRKVPHLVHQHHRQPGTSNSPTTTRSSPPVASSTTRSGRNSPSRSRNAPIPAASFPSTPRPLPQYSTGLWKLNPHVHRCLCHVYPPAILSVVPPGSPSLMNSDYRVRVTVRALGKLGRRDDLSLPRSSVTQWPAGLIACPHGISLVPGYKGQGEGIRADPAQIQLLRRACPESRHGVSRVVRESRGSDPGH